MRLALAQLAVTDDQNAALGLLDGAVRDAASRGADLVVLPEYASGFDPRGPRPGLAENRDGPFRNRVLTLAAKHGIAVAAGRTVREPSSAEPVRGAVPRVRNEIVVADASGTPVLGYHKVHLYDSFGARESDVLLAGDPAAPAAVGRFAGIPTGFMTCYDLRFPESGRRLVDAGAELLIVPAAWAAGPRKTDQWSVLLRARAIENVAVVAAASMTGRGVVGCSAVVGPDGHVRGELGAEPGMLVVDLEAAEVRRARGANSSLAHRRYRVLPGHRDITAVPGAIAGPAEAGSVTQ